MVLVVDDDKSVCELTEEGLGARGHDVDWVMSGDRALEQLRDRDYDVMLSDLCIGEEDGIELCERATAARPDLPVVMMTGYGSMDAAVRALRAGAYDFVTKPLELERLAATVHRAAEHRALRAEVQRLRREVQAVSGAKLGMVGESDAMKKVFDLIERVADTDTTVLVTGESGTGKELVSRALHNRSPRADGPFIAINCAAMPASLLESELFGHVRGAFTDARRTREGLFLQASGGTLFLDEIGEMPLEMQAKLLRALQEKQVRPVGGDDMKPFDARIVCATNKDLETLIEQNRFREDLYYRIAVVNVDLPPLSARGHDVLRLAQRFVEEFAEETGRAVRGLSQGAAEKLLEYDWPGNVRELRNCLERAVTLARLDEITVDDLPPRVRQHRPSHVFLDTQDPQELPSLADLERRYVDRVLRLAGGNKSRAARILGVDRRTLYRKLDRWEKADQERRSEPPMEAARA